MATFSVDCELDLKTINSRTRNSEYSPKRFRGVIMRMHSPRCTALIFRTGKVICTGARNETEANIGSRKFARILQKLGFPVKFVDYKLQNIVATGESESSSRPIQLIRARNVSRPNLSHGQAAHCSAHICQWQSCFYRRQITQRYNGMFRSHFPNIAKFSQNVVFSFFIKFIL